MRNSHGPFIVDFFCPDRKLIVEIDGEQHAWEHNRQADLKRARWLESEGHVVIRFWTSDVMHNLDGVCEAILAASVGDWKNEPPPETG